MFDQRLEQLLISLGQQHAQNALRSWNAQGDLHQRLPALARELANYNMLVIMGDFPQTLATIGQDVNAQIQSWVNGYGQFYGLLTRALFPSYTHFSAHYTDDRWPVVIYMIGAATPVIRCMAGYVAPYIVQRQFESIVSEAELIGLMDLILDELEAASLGRDAYKALRAEGVALLKAMLSTAIRQLPLTEFDRQIFSDSQRIIPVQINPLPEPPALPEDSQITRTDIRALPTDHVAYNAGRQADTESLQITHPYEGSNVPDLPPGLPEDGGQPRGNNNSGREREEGGRRRRRAPLPPPPGKKD